LIHFYKRTEYVSVVGLPYEVLVDEAGWPKKVKSLECPHQSLRDGEGKVKEMMKIFLICHIKKSETFRNINRLSEQSQSFEGLR